MIRAHGTYRAVFKREGQKEHALPIEAWSKRGDALFVSTTTGALLPARHDPNFLRLEETERFPVVAVIPGGGWRLAYIPYDDPKAQERVLPVVAWSVDEDGEARPLIVYPGCEFAQRPLEEDRIRLIPPYDSRQPSKDFSDWDTPPDQPPTTPAAA
jgi:hypothetical protein